MSIAKSTKYISTDPQSIYLDFKHQICENLKRDKKSTLSKRKVMMPSLNERVRLAVVAEQLPKALVSFG